mmetsp:Transcript_69071/g.186670  ORF Transcript_69071/g.186670 Transcript_69071/m.186670 type:complete len:255 (+) Transcript_69071:224-988(+)
MSPEAFFAVFAWWTTASLALFTRWPALFSISPEAFFAAFFAFFTWWPMLSLMSLAVMSKTLLAAFFASCMRWPALSTASTVASTALDPCVMAASNVAPAAEPTALAALCQRFHRAEPSWPLRSMSSHFHGVRYCGSSETCTPCSQASRHSDQYSSFLKHLSPAVLQHMASEQSAPSSLQSSSLSSSVMGLSPTTSSSAPAAPSSGAAVASPASGSLQPQIMSPPLGCRAPHSSSDSTWHPSEWCPLGSALASAA